MSTQTVSKSKIIENLKKENSDLKKELDDAKLFFHNLVIIKLPLAVKGHPAIVMECLISKEVAVEISKLTASQEPEVEQTVTINSLPADEKEEFPKMVMDELKDNVLVE